MNKGFTLVELAIVIVIIGLLVGGVLQGQELIKQSKIQNILKTVESFKAATYTFKAKYGDLPGDSARHSIFLPAAGILEGNANGSVETHQELLEYWKALGAAKVIKGTYTGHPGGGGAATITITNMASDSASNYYIFRCHPGNTYAYPPYAKNGCYFYISKPGTGLNTVNLGWAVLPVDDTRALDIKTDDGFAYSGRFLGSRQTAGGPPLSCTGTDPYVASPTNTDYLLTDTVGCVLLFEFNP